jgi:hypothetical protein
MAANEPEETDDRLRELGITNPSLSVAKGIDHLSIPKGAAVRTLSVVTKNDLPRVNLFYAVSNLTGWKWTEKSIERELEARASMARKGKRGRDDIVTIAQNQEEHKGALDTFRDKIKSFFSSGE